MFPLPRLLLGALLLLAPLPAAAAAPAPAECSGPGGAGPSHCLYRSVLPSAGIVADCVSDRDCRVGYYYGGPERATWYTPPQGMASLPKPRRDLAHGDLRRDALRLRPPCAWSYFFEARRHLLSEPRRDVLDVDYRRLLMAQVDGRALAIRQIFSARDVLRTRAGLGAGALRRRGDHGDPLRPRRAADLHLAQGSGRERVSERVSVPSFAR